MSEAPLPPLIACPDCDALQRAAPAGAHARGSACWRCGAWLVRGHGDRTERVLALALAAVVLFIVANVYPVISLSLPGNPEASTLFGAARALWNQGMEPVAILVFMTTIALPGLQLGALTWLSLGLVLTRRGVWPRPPAGAATLLHIAERGRAWSMLEVFMLASLVSIVRLSGLASVSIGIALWSCGGVILLLAAITETFDPAAYWQRLDELGMLA